jgi:hypothetical protein
MTLCERKWAKQSYDKLRTCFAVFPSMEGTPLANFKSGRQGELWVWILTWRVSEARLFDRLPLLLVWRESTWRACAGSTWRAHFHYSGHEMKIQTAK